MDQGMIDNILKKNAVKKFCPKKNACLIRYEAFNTNGYAINFLFVIARADFPNLRRMDTEMVVTNEEQLGIIFRAIDIPIPDDYEIVEELGPFLIDSSFFLTCA